MEQIPVYGKEHTFLEERIIVSKFQPEGNSIHSYAHVL